MVFYLFMLVINTNLFIFPLSYWACSETHWQVTGKSQIEISGSTNINEFHCLSVNYGGEDIMIENCPQDGKNASLNGEIFMKASGIDCHNSIMTRDFARTVKANEFPKISIRFIELEENLSRKNVLLGKVEITLAGKSKIYMVSCLVREKSENSKHLEGNRTFYFSDFGLQPPQKLFGAVKVKDAVSVDFHLKLQKIQ